MTPIEMQGNIAVKELRKTKFSMGIPFMINARELPPLQCYLEYPNGRITLVQLISQQHDFIPIRDLTAEEAFLVRERHGLN